ncbi:MAG: hypothetical protein HRT73_01005, partial [Flavobacteriales bacterium]|nr:hypothetical protein [Flavobacteriales bacterium]
MEEQDVSLSPEFEKKFISFVGKFGILISLLLLPPFFTNFLTVSTLVLNEVNILWGFSTLLLIISLFQIIVPNKIKISYSFIFFVLLLFMTVEVITRVYVNISYEDKAKKELGMF